MRGRLSGGLPLRTLKKFSGMEHVATLGFECKFSMSAIKCLFTLGGPTDISGLIMSVVSDSVQRVTLGWPATYA